MMSGPIHTGSERENGLVTRCRQSEHDRALARRCITLLILGVIAVGICLAWTAITDFRDRRLPEFTAAMGVELASISPDFISDVRDMVDRLYPYYSLAFQRMFERDWDKMRDAALGEMKQLDAHAQKRWPEMENGILDFILTTEEVLREELGKFVTPADLEKITAAYGAALQAEYSEIFSSTLQSHVKVTEHIGSNLQEMIHTEPDITKPIETQEVLGILLELAGTELQKRPLEMGTPQTSEDETSRKGRFGR